MKRTATVLFILLSGILMTRAQAQSEFSSPLVGVGVVVSDLEESLKFYTEVIGMTKVSDFKVAEKMARNSGLSGGTPFHVHVLKLEDSDDANVWKLMSFDREAPHPPSEFIQDDVGMQYITIRVSSLKPFLERIKDHKIKMEGNCPVELDGGRGFVLIRDPDGVFIELIGPME